MKLKDDILFLEDDYLWRPNTLIPFMEGLNRFGFVSPYDHPDFYYKDEPTAIGARVVGTHLWRRCPTNTHTFGVRRGVLEDFYDEFDQNQFDWLMYTRLAVKGIPCFTPLTSFATHINSGHLAYNVDWESLAKSYS
jgi:hypothetical protein